jgi:uncharacterized Zn finger protein (UPF0148 family)
MDVKIGAGMQKAKCPRCGGSRLLRIQRGGEPRIVCPCGYEKNLKKYPTNAVDSSQIETR